MPEIVLRSALAEALAAAGHHVVRFDNRDAGLSTFVDAPPPSIPDLALRRNVAYTLTRQWRATGGRAGLPCIKVGRSVRVPRADLDRIIRSAHTNDHDHQVA